MTQLCPLCAAPASPANAPFCSPRCRDRDLLNWLGEAYRLPGREGVTEALDTVENRD